MFTTKQKLIASSICHIFETSKPLGNSTTVAVLNDRAGISYGIPQATHKSGNLLDVIERYIASADEVLYEPLFRKYLPALRKSDQRTVDRTARDEELKRALREAGNEPEMRKAQLDNVNERMSKAIRACAGSRFTTTMALAVIYDSINHGSWEKIRDRVKVSDTNEKAWIKAYVQERHAWLKSIPRLASTSYRTKFYLEQIAAGNWNLNLPVVAHGFTLKVSHIEAAEREIEEIGKLQGANSNNYVQTEQTENEASSNNNSTEANTETITHTSSDGDATANATVNLEDGTKDEIDAASKADPVEINGTKPVKLWDKIVGGVTAILTGAWIIPKFDLSDGQLRIVEMIFPYLMIGLLLALPIWYAVKKYNNYQLTKLKATINSDSKLKDVVMKPYVPENTWGYWFKSNIGWVVAIVLVLVNVIAILLK